MSGICFKHLLNGFNVKLQLRNALWQNRLAYDIQNQKFFFYFYRWIKLQSIHFERYNIKMLVKKYLTLSLAEVIKYIHNSLGKGLV